MKICIKSKKVNPTTALKVASFALCLGVSVHTSAQESNLFACFPSLKSPLGLFAKEEEETNKMLVLSEEQLKKIDAINDEYVLDWQALREDKIHSRREKSILKKRLKADRDERFKAVLTEAQLKRWNKFKQNAAIRKASNMP